MCSTKPEIYLTARNLEGFCKSVKAEFRLILTVSNRFMLCHGKSEAAALHFKSVYCYCLEFYDVLICRNPQNRTDYERQYDRSNQLNQNK